MEWKDIVTHVVDCGSRQSTIYTVKTDHTEVLSHAEVLNLPERLPQGSVVVAEKAHLGAERTKFSLSQPYTRDQLQDFYRRLEQADMKLWLFPQRSTPRACAYSGLPKSDMNDPKSIYLLLKDFPEISMAKPPQSFDASPKRREQWEYKRFTGHYVNMARAEHPRYSSDGCSKYLRDESTMDYLFENLSDRAKDLFGLTYLTKAGKLKLAKEERDTEYHSEGEWRFDNSSNTVNMQALYAVCATLIDPDGNIRVRPYTGEVAGWSYISEGVFCQSPFHYRGDVARSNLYWHLLKNWIIRTVKREHNLILKSKSRGGYFDDDKVQIKEGSRFTPEEDKLFREYRAIGCKAIREVWQLLKKDLLSKQGLGVNLYTRDKTGIKTST